MSLPPASQNPYAALENWDLKAEQIQGEEQERLAQIEDRFHETPEYSQLSAIVEDKNILNAIVTAYAEVGKDLEKAIHIVFTDPTIVTRIGLKFDSPDDGRQAAEALIGEMKNGNQEIQDSNTPTGENEIENTEKSQKDTQEIPGMPRLERMSESGGITPEEMIGIQQKIQSGNTLIPSIKSTITDIGKQEQILSFFQEQDPEKRAENFFQDMPDAVAQDTEHPTVQLIAENYTQIPGINGEPASPEADFKTAIQEAANKVVDGKVFPRTEGFERAMDTIKSGKNKKAMFTALGEVRGYVNNHAGIRGKVGKNTLKQTQQRKAETEMARETTFGELIATAKENADKQQQAQIQKAMEARQAEAQDTVDTGDGGLGGDILDMVSETSSETPKTSA